MFVTKSEERWMDFEDRQELYMNLDENIFGKISENSQEMDLQSKTRELKLTSRCIIAGASPNEKSIQVLNLGSRPQW